MAGPVGAQDRLAGAVGKAQAVGQSGEGILLTQQFHLGLEPGQLRPGLGQLFQQINGLRWGVLGFLVRGGS
jgi:hypothetical protein